MQKQLTMLILVILGLYFLLAHTEPWPLNHEAIGLGTYHIAHSIFGFVLLGGAVYLFKKNKSNKTQEEAKPEVPS